jgi:hypothetical protein
MDENQAKLERLRSEIVEDLVPIVEEADVDPEQRFTLLLATARLSGSEEKFRKAHKAAMDIQDTQARAGALMDLLDAVDSAVAAVSAEPPAAQETENPPSDQ